MEVDENEGQRDDSLDLTKGSAGFELKRKSDDQSTQMTHFKKMKFSVPVDIEQMMSDTSISDNESDPKVSLN